MNSRSPGYRAGPIEQKTHHPAVPGTDGDGGARGRERQGVYGGAAGVSGISPGDGFAKGGEMNVQGVIVLNKNMHEGK